MTKSDESEVHRLLRRARGGDPTAVDQLLTRHRSQLQRMIAVRMDPRLASRVDPSDVVQETFIVAVQRMDDYLNNSAIAFYPWLREIATQRLIDLYRRHMKAEKRTVCREVSPGLSDQSAMILADCLAASATSPSGRATRKETIDHVKTMLEQLAESDREILVLRHLEELSTGQAAEVLGISQSAAKMRHLRAVQRLQQLLRAGEA